MTLPASRTIRDGIVVGLIGYVAVAAFYSAFDLLAARGTLYTVDLLGLAVFRGLRDPSILQFPLQLDWTAIFLYNALHFVASLGIGQIVLALVDYAEEIPSRAPIAAAIIVAGFVVTVLGAGWLTVGMRPVLPWWSIVVANGLATAVAGWYLVSRRPGLVKRLLLRPSAVPRS